VTQELISEPEEFGARLALALNAINMSRSQLSAALSVDKSVVSRWMSGQVAPSSYNLARISSLIANARPGFNMTVWTAPRAEFEAALGISISGAPASLPAAPTPRTQADGPTKHVPPRRPTASRPTLFAATAGAILLLCLVAAWLAWHRSSSHTATDHTPPSPASVAVMPFINMSGDPSKEYLGDGISEEILNDLANTPNLRVAARTSSFAFKGTHTGIGEIARKLNVRTVLEGSVRQQGDRLRIVAQLIDAQSGFHLWSARYDRKLDDILAVQDKIAGAIVAALSQKLVRTRPAPRISPEAYRDYLQAQYFFRQRTVSGFKRAGELLKSVLQREPNFAAAYAMRAHLLHLTARDDLALLAEAQRMVSKALQLEPGNQDALDTQIELSIGLWNWPVVYRAGRQLLAQPKRTGNYYNGIGFFYQYMGFPKLALEARREAVELDPLAFSYWNNLAMAKWHVGRLNEAIATARGALDIQPNHLGGLYNMCQMTAASGKISEARHYAKVIAALPSPQFPWVPTACEIEIAIGEHRTAQALELLHRMDGDKIGDARLGLLYARAGDLNAAMKLFSVAYNLRDQGLIWIRYDAGTQTTLLQDRRWLALWQRPLLRDWQKYHDRIAAELTSETFH